MNQQARQEWPIGSYMHSWKLFRRMSNENEETAVHLLSRSRWPRHDDLVLLDVGCGDGLLVEQIVHTNGPIAEVRLLDPDDEFLDQAEANITETGIVKNVKRFAGLAEDHFATASAGVDVILAVHVGYLMQDAGFEKMLGELPASVPLYVVVDTPNSVFSTLWERTANKYWVRSATIHRAIESLPATQFEVNRSTISSRLLNPLEHRQPAIRQSVLSILCYNEFSNMSPSDQQWVENTIQRHIVGDEVVCDSDCFEIVKL